MDAIIKVPTPRNVSDLCSYLCLLTYYTAIPSHYSLGIFIMLYPVFLTIFIFTTEELEKVTMKTKPNSLVDLIVILPVFCFAYQAHEVVVPIYANMRDRRLANLAKAAIVTTAFLFIIHTLIGTFGYMAYGSTVKPDIMQMFDASNPWVLVGVGTLILKMVTTYPLLTYCGRGAIDGLYAELTKLPTKRFIQGEPRRRVFITTGWFFTTVGLATFTSNVGVMIELLGCLAAVNAFIFPGLCLLGLFHQQVRFGLRRPMTTFIIGAVLVVIGSFIFGVVLLSAIMHDITKGGSNHLLCT